MTGAVDLGAPETLGTTPRRVFLAGVARRRLQDVAALRERLARPHMHVLSGYSFKTNPRPELVTMARAAGFIAETISCEEVRLAQASGFLARDVTYNGPAPFQARAGAHPLGYIFADSLEAFERNIRAGVARVQGVRLRPSMIASRFGISVDEDAGLCSVIARLPADACLGVSFHARREDFAGATWLEVARDVVDRAAAIERVTGRTIVAFDVGGGWTPEEFDDVFYEDMCRLIDVLVDALPSCTRVLIEPGQAICTPTEALLTQVTEVRCRGRRREAVIDAAYSDWPQMHEYRHGLFAWRQGRWEPIGRGPDALAGRTCLEYDRIDGLRLPADLAAGDRVLIADVGSYDHSMAFDFARGNEAAVTFATRQNVERVVSK